MRQQTKQAREILRQLDRLELHMRQEMELMRLKLEGLAKVGAAAPVSSEQEPEWCDTPDSDPGEWVWVKFGGPNG